MHPEINPFLLYEFMTESEFKPIFESLVQKNVLFLYVENDEVLGMCKLIRAEYRCNHIMYLGGLAVEPKYFGKGFGSRIIQEIIDYCKKNEILRIELSVAVFNHKAIQLYEKMNFKKEGLMKNYTYLKKENLMIDEILMSNLI